MPQTVPTLEARPLPRLAAVETTPARHAADRTYRLGVLAASAAAAGFLAARLTAWAPHEDEVLAVFVGQGSLAGLLDTVLGERGGAPLHFVLAWIVAHAGGGLTGLRVVSALFAVASVPLVAALARRLTDRTTAVLAAALAATSWVLLFHGIYARMYSLFLFTSALSFLALLRAQERGGARHWAGWAAATLLMVATHPYGALVLAAQGIYVLLTRERLRQAVAAFAAVGVLGIPFWITDLVLAGRFDVGVGGGGPQLGSPGRVLAYLGEVAADFSAGPVLLPATLALAAAGAVVVWRTSRKGALLAAAAFGVPTLAFLVARLGASAAPETRHLIFALPFFVTLLAAGVVAVARSSRPGARPAGAVAAAVLLVGGVAWAYEKTPEIFRGEPAVREAAREAATRWLAATGRPDDVLLGYEPLYLGAWQSDPAFSRLVLPRADARLQAEALAEAEKPLGRGVWVLNAWDTTNWANRLTIPARRPRPAEAFEARAFGPFLVLRTWEPTVTPQRYLTLGAAAMVVGKSLGIGDADINFATLNRAAETLGYEVSASSASRSASSR